MNRKWQIRVLVLIILLVFGFYVRYHKKAASYIKRYALVEAKDSNQITGISVIKTNDTISLRRKGENWVVFYKGRTLPANNDKVENIVAKLLKSTYQVAGTNTKDMAIYAISDTTSVKVALYIKNKKTVELIMGKRGPVYSSFYCVFPGKKKVYLLSGIAPYIISTKVDDYRNKEVVDLKKEDIKALTLVDGNDTLKIRRKGDTLISIPKKDTSFLNGVIQRARVLTAFGFADEEQDSLTGLKNTGKKVIFLTMSDDTIIVNVGNEGKRSLYVSVNKRPNEVFKVYKSWFKEVEKKVGFLTGPQK